MCILFLSGFTHTHGNKDAARRLTFDLPGEMLIDLISKNKELEKENEELKMQIKYIPGGEVYKEQLEKFESKTMD